ncbi:MAG TPA: O-antigen ligase family protein [Acidimicrobiales bacterium]|nr:O-antigen ligase family protein [Acidimicrobiales bacterium]
MSTSAPVGRALPLAAVFVVTVAAGFLSWTIDPKILGAAVAGTIVVVLIRVYPMVTLFSLAATRSSLEILQTKNVLRVAGIALSPTDLISIAFLGGVALTLLAELRSGSEVWRAPMIVPAAFFLGFGVVSLFYSQAIGEGARAIVKWGSAFGAYALVQADRPDARRLRLLLGLVVGSAVFPLLWGGYQLLHDIGRQNLLHGGLRIQSTFNHPNDYGFYLVVVLVAVWGLYDMVDGWSRRAVLLIGVAAFGSVALTLSRSAYAALGLVVLVVGMRNRRVLIGLSAIGGVILLAAPRIVQRVTDLVNPREGDNHGNSLLGRLSIWSDELQSYREHPLMGHGWGYTLASQDKASHNDYLRMMVEGGIVGLISIVILMASLLRAAWRASRARIDLPRAFLGLAFGYVVDSGVTNTIGKGAFQFYFWLMAGIALRWAVVVRPRSDDTDDDGAAVEPQSTELAAVT